MAFEPQKRANLFALVYLDPKSYPMGRMVKKAEKDGKRIFRKQRFEVLQREWRDDLNCGVSCWLVWIGNPNLDMDENTSENEGRVKKTE